MIWKEIRENTLYVYHRGRLIYKRWLWRGYGLVMDAYGSHRWPKDRTASLPGKTEGETRGDRL